MTPEFIEDPLLGPAVPDLGWVPAPRYLLRRRRILRQLEDTQATAVLEIGSGAGMLLQELHARGFECHALETSVEARELIVAVSQCSGRNVTVHGGINPGWDARFPLVLAFEVLEHIEDDLAALTQWSRWLSPGGTLLMSVPAHPSQWNAADVWAGHFRRYTRQQLLNTVERSGLSVDHIECIGFPLGNLTERLQARAIARDNPAESDQGNRQANNDRSGIDRQHVLGFFPFLRSLPGRAALRACFGMQAITTGLPWGNGYLLRATKPL